MPKPKKSRDAAPDDPDRLIRQHAGTYRTADGRFEVRESAGAWFLVDSGQANEFGQELVRGPFASRKAAGEALSDARRPPPTPLRRPTRSTRDKPAERRREPAPPPQTWIDRLAPAERRSVSALIRALEQAGVADAEGVVRRDRESGRAEIATTLIATRVEAFIDGAPRQQRAAARNAAEQVLAILTRDGEAVRSPLPGWTLVELTGDRPPPSNRRISVGGAPVRRNAGGR
ncbi:MAG: hypothetical protein M3295_04890 [Chloroflexota bacterium]|nr:hypothetical protein [Chloroflexota bacterium]